MMWLFLAVATAAPFDAGQTYRMEVEVASVSKVPVFGRTEVLTRSTLLVTVEEQEGRWMQRMETCQIRIEDSSKMATTYIPDNFVAGLPVQFMPVDLERDGSRWRYEGDPGPTFVGYDPTESGGVVPERQRDLGVVDWDADGQPGATVHLKVPVFGWVELYVAQRTHTLFSGAVTADGTGGGSVHVAALEQRTLGASVGLFRANALVEADDAGSRWTIAPAAVGTSCTDLRDGLAEAP